MLGTGVHVRRLQDLLILVVGVAASVAVFFAAERKRQEAERQKFVDMSRAYSMALQSKLEGALEVLHYIPALHYSTTDVSRGEFARFVRATITRVDIVRAVQWVPRVPASARTRFEASAINDGRAGFRFTDRAGPGVLVPAAERDSYLPVFYSEPNDESLGLDLLSVHELREPAERARDEDRMTSSAPFRPPESPDGALELALFMPVYARDLPHDSQESRRTALEGLAVVILTAEPLVDVVLGEALEDPAFSVAILDVDAPPYDRVLYESDLGLGLSTEHDAALEHRDEFEFADRRWSVTFTRRARKSARPWFTLALGLVFTVIVMLAARAVRLVTRLRRRVEEAQKLGQYTLLKRLGEGGMGVVYRARHAMLRRPTAIKLLRPELKGRALAERFEREVQLTSKLTHPNIVAIYDYGKTPQGLFYYAMEFIDGISLAELVALDGAQPPARVVFIVRQIASALVDAHDNGLLHRDISPANIMLTRRGGMHDFVKVLDFGLVKDIGEEREEQTGGRKLLGTPKYLAPERISSATRGEEDERVDLYALGAVAYYLLVGDHVFTGTSVAEVCAQHLNEPPRPPTWRTENSIPMELERLILRLLAKSPDERPGTARDLLAALAAVKVDPWTEQDAADWWIRHAEKIKTASHHAVRTIKSDEAQQRTVVIDLQARSGTQRSA